MPAPTTVIETMKVKDLKPAPYNPRRIDAASMAALEKSLDTFGVVQPIVWNKRTGFVVGGHQRLKALKARKVAEVACVVVDLDEKDEKALNVALNSPSLMGEFTASLVPLLDEIEANNAQLFAELRLGSLRTDAKADVEIAGKPSPIPDPPPSATTKAGEVWCLGRHRLMCGDSTNAGDVERLLAGAKPSFALTDPPYSVNYAGSFSKRERGLLGAQQCYQEGDDPTALLSATLISMPDLVAMTYPVDRHFFELTESLLQAGFESVRELIWVKQSPTFHPGAAYQQMHEPILILRRPGIRYPDSIPADAKTVLSFDRPSRHGDHPTEKPLDMWTTILEWHTTKGDLVHEPFGGSGTTIIACEKTGRTCFSMEMSPQFCDVIVQRWEELTGGKAVLEHG